MRRGSRGRDGDVDRDVDRDRDRSTDNDCDGGRIVESDFGNCPSPGCDDGETSSASTREEALGKSARSVPVLLLLVVVIIVVIVIGSEGLGKCIERKSVLLQKIVNANDTRRTIRRARSWRFIVVVALSRDVNGDGGRRKRVDRAMIVLVVEEGFGMDGRGMKDGDNYLLYCIFLFVAVRRSWSL